MMDSLRITSEIVDIVWKGNRASPSREYVDDAPPNMQVQRVSPNIRHVQDLRNGEQAIWVQREGKSLFNFEENIREFDYLASEQKKIIQGLHDKYKRCDEERQKGKVEFELKVEHLEDELKKRDETRKAVKLQFELEANEHANKIKQLEQQLAKVFNLVVIREVWSCFKKSKVGMDILRDLLNKVRSQYEKKVVIKSLLMNTNPWKIASHRKYLSEEVVLLRAKLKRVEEEMKAPTTSASHISTLTFLKKSVEQCLKICKEIFLKHKDWGVCGKELWKMMEVAEEGNAYFHDAGVSAAEIITLADLHKFMVDDLDLGAALKLLLGFLPDYDERN